jgi:hypothetical protein
MTALIIEEEIAALRRLLDDVVIEADAAPQRPLQFHDHGSDE